MRHIVNFLGYKYAYKLRLKLNVPVKRITAININYDNNNTYNQCRNQHTFSGQEAREIFQVLTPRLLYLLRWCLPLSASFLRKGNSSFSNSKCLLLSAKDCHTIPNLGFLLQHCKLHL